MPVGRATPASGADTQDLLQVCHVTVGVDSVEGVYDPAVGVDDESRADDADHRLTVSDLLTPDSVRLVGRTVGIAQQVIGQMVTGAEFTLLLRKVAGDSEHLIP